MHVQCSAERLSTASRFDDFHYRHPFPRFNGRLAEILELGRTKPEPAPAEYTGQLAMAAVLTDLEETPGNLNDLSEISSTTSLIQGPGGTVTAYSLDYLGPGESLL